MLRPQEEFPASSVSLRWWLRVVTSPGGRAHEVFELPGFPSLCSFLV